MYSTCMLYIVLGKKMSGKGSQPTAAAIRMCLAGTGIGSIPPLFFLTISNCCRAYQMSPWPTWVLPNAAFEWHNRMGACNRMSRGLQEHEWQYWPHITWADFHFYPLLRWLTVALASVILSVNQWHTWKKREDSEVNKYLGNGVFLKFKMLCLYCVSAGKQDIWEVKFDRD